MLYPNRNVFQAAPFIRISIFFATGIVLGSLFYFSETIWLSILLPLLLSLFLFLPSKNFRSVQISNALLAITLIILGAWHRQQFSQTNPDISLQKASYQAIILEQPTEKKNSYQTILQVANRETPSTRVIAWFSKKTDITQLQSGQKIIMQAKLNPIRNQGNPYEFDYQSYMHRQGIDYSTFINEFQTLPEKRINIFIWADNLRSKLLHLIRQHGVGGEAYTVVAALTFGYRKELDPETRDYFSTSGAMHVLAVSGLHVGIVFMIASWLLMPLRKRKAGRYFYLLAVGGTIWFYALLSGLSPSVQRASVMFTFILIGQNLKRPANIFNSLAASAFLLMLFNPQIICEVGFQLSYLAVSGIVLFHPLFYRIFEFKNTIADKAWSLFCVSLSAQIITFPLGVFYFNQFPNYFWLSNFIVIPLASIILPGTFLLLAVSFISPIADLVGFVVQKSTELMLWSLKTIDRFPFALIENISFSAVQTILILLIIAAIYWFISTKELAVLRISFVLVLAFCISSFIRNLSLFNQQKIIVYRAEQPVIHLINGRKNYVLAPNSFLNSEKIERLIVPTRNHLKLNTPRIIAMSPNTTINHKDLKIRNSDIYFAKKIILWNAIKPMSIPADLAIYDQQGFLDNNNSDAQTIVYTGKKNIEQKQENIHPTETKGAFILNINK